MQTRPEFELSPTPEPAHPRTGLAHATTRRGFSLMELLVVVGIIVLIVAIIFPALGNARQAARMAETQTLLTDLSNAFAQFSTDNRRNPGVFSEQLMGAAANASEQGGLTALQNAMLELAGGIVSTDGGANTVTVYPGFGDPSAVVYVDPNLIGARAGGDASVYFAPREKFFNTGDEGHHHGLQGNPEYRERLPNLVDAWSNPIMLWSRDPAATGRIVLPNATPTAGENRFASVASPPPNTNRALFYLNSNWGVLSSQSFGRGRNDLTDANAGSFLGVGGNPTDRAIALTALLGSPTFPANPTETNLENIAPSSPRGDYVLTSAGPDGVFLGRNDRRGRSFGTGPNALPRYGDMFAALESGGGTADIIAAFDDMIVAGGN